MAAAGTQPDINFEFSTEDDGKIAQALADLDAKLSAWTGAMRDARDVLTTKRPSTPTPQDEVVPEAPGASSGVSSAPIDFDSPIVKAPLEMPTDADDDDDWAPAGSPESAPLDGAVKLQWPGEETTETGADQAAPAQPSSPPSGGTGVVTWPTETSGDAAAGAAGVDSPVAKSPVQGPVSAPLPGQSPGPNTAVPPSGDGSTTESPEEIDAVLALVFDEEIVRRARIVKRMDPTTPMKEIVERLRKAKAEQAPDDKANKRTSWWRRK